MIKQGPAEQGQDDGYNGRPCSPPVTVKKGGSLERSRKTYLKHYAKGQEIAERRRLVREGLL